METTIAKWKNYNEDNEYLTHPVETRWPIAWEHGLQGWNVPSLWICANYLNSLSISHLICQNRDNWTSLLKRESELNKIPHTEYLTSSQYVIIVSF